MAGRLTLAFAIVLALIHCINMKKVLLLFVLLFFGLQSFAQTFEESIRYWSDGPLTWDDLRLKQTKDTSICDLTFRWMHESDTLRPAWNTVSYNKRPVVVLYKPTSWHNAGRQDSLALAYDQLMFDLNEVYFRKLLTENSRKERSANTLVSFYTEEIQYRIDEMNSETSNGSDAEAIQTFRQQIDAELASTSYPEPERPTMDFGLTYYAGAAARIFCGDPAETFSPAFGGSFGMSYMYKRHSLDLMLSACDGHLYNSFNYDGHLWPLGDDYSHNMIGLLYKYLAYTANTFYIEPLVGIAGRMVTWSTGTGANRVKSDATSTVALFGLETDFIFARTIRDREAIEHSVYLRAFAARNITNNGVAGWSMNFGLGYCFGLHN